MKRVLSIISLLLLLIIPNVNAISINELNSNPQRYIVIAETETETSYLDCNSIKSIRYAPPYYAIEYNTIMINYPNKEISIFKGMAFYNLNNTDKVIISFSLDAIYSFDGELLLKRNNSVVNAKENTCKINTNGYEEASIVFHKVYGIDYPPTNK